MAGDMPFPPTAGTDLSTTVLRDGTQGMQADLPMGGKKVTGAADGIAVDDLVTRRQLHLLKIKNADQGKANSTLADDAELTFTVESLGRYKYRLILYVTLTTISSGFKMAMGGTAGVSSSLTWIRFLDIGSGFPWTAIDETFFTTYGTTKQVLPVTGSIRVEVEGTIDFATGAGTVLLQFAQAANNGGTTAVKAGSFMELEKVT